MAIIDKIPLFVNNKERPLRNKLFKGNKKVALFHTNSNAYYNNCVS